MRFNAKQLERESAKCRKKEAVEKKKIKAAMESGQMEVARIHAENAIRQKNQSINFLRLSARMDAIAQRLQSANSIKSLSKNMASCTKAMSKAVESMNIKKLTKTMDEFEQTNEELDIQSATMEDAMAATGHGITPEDEVKGLMFQVADEHGLEVQQQMAVVPSGQLGQRQQEKESANADEDDLLARLNQLKS
jgi:charged multivesicular body protein 1